MDARIVGEHGHLVGVEVVDNEGHGHEISIDGRSGTVAVHVTDAYPADLGSRSPEETERLRQAQRYARRTFDRTTRPAAERPERLRAVRGTLASLSRDAFEASFGRLHDQLVSHVDPRTDRPVDLPAAVGDPDAVLYRQAVALDAAGDLSAVSGLETVYRDRYQARRRVREGTPLAAEADARLELQPHYLADRAGDGHDVGSFRALLDRHLACQVRDRYVGMGVDPPEDVRGPGTHAAVVRYRTLGTYPPYHDDSADVFRE